MLRDFLKAAERVWDDAWGHEGYMVTRPVTIKAMIRVCADLTHSRSVLGYSPATDLREGLQMFAHWYRGMARAQG